MGVSGLSHFHAEDLLFHLLPVVCLTAMLSSFILTPLHSVHSLSRSEGNLSIACFFSLDV